MKPCRSLRTGALLALSSSLPAFAAQYVGAAYEGFDYPAGAITASSNGGTGWNAAGDNSANTASWAVGTSLTVSGQGAAVQTTGLSSSTPGYPAPTGASALVSGATAGSSVGRQFGQSVDAGTFYFSFLTQKANNEFRTVNLSFFGTNERLAIGQFASNPNTRDQDGNWLSSAGAHSGNFAALISNSQNNSAAQTTVGPAANGVYVNTTTPAAYSSTSVSLIVGKIEFNFAGGVEDRFTLYVNPTGAEGALVPYLVIDHNDFGSLTGFRIFAGTTANGFNASGGIFDEIRFGTTFAAVTTGAAASDPWQDWLAAHFTAEERALPAVSGENADPDGDGHSNLLEYGFGSDPRSALGGPVPALREESGTLVLDYPAPRSGLDLNYVAETCTDLATWTTVGVTSGPAAGNPGWRTASVARGENQRVFLRVRVTKID